MVPSVFVLTGYDYKKKKDAKKDANREELNLHIELTCKPKDTICSNF